MLLTQIAYILLTLADTQWYCRLATQIAYMLLTQIAYMLLTQIAYILLHVANSS
jgi:hypothetical protein